MTPLRLRLRKSEFDAVKYGKLTEVVKHASNKRIHYLCLSRMTHDCKEPQSSCRDCFASSFACGGYECYPFDKAVIRRAGSDIYITKGLSSVAWEEREGKIVFVVKLKAEEYKDGKH